MVPTKKSDCNTRPAPKKSEVLGYEAVFSAAEMNFLKMGFMPEDMDDKWFIYFQDNELFLHRSWTGSLIYWLKFDECPAGFQVVESWVSRNPEEYTEESVSHDRHIIDFLIRRLLLNQQ